MNPLQELGFEVEVLTWTPHRSSAVAMPAAKMIAFARRVDVGVVVKSRIHPRLVDGLRRIQPRLVVDVGKFRTLDPMEEPRAPRGSTDGAGRRGQAQTRGVS